MKKTTSFFLVLIFAITVPSVSFAWGKKGHAIVAEIAFSLLDSNVQRSVLKYLDSTTIEEASVWMDEMRSNPKYNYMKPWHYVNIEKGSDYTETTEPNVINALNKAIVSLKYKDTLSDADIKTNLLIVFHLTGDLHMPLHAGYSADKGGNSVQVKYLGRETNLHKVWDTEIIESENITTDDCLKRLKSFTKKDIKKYIKIDVEAWTHESRGLLDNVYDFKDDTIDQAYVDKNKTIVEDRLILAGIRLAAILENSFKS